MPDVSDETESVAIANSVQLLLGGHTLQVGMDALCRCLVVSAVSAADNQKGANRIIDELHRAARENVRLRFKYLKQRLAEQNVGEGRA